MRPALAIVLSLLACVGCRCDSRAKTEPGPVLATTLNFDCRSKNVGVLTTKDTDLSVACDASALDATGLALPDANIRFLEEAGKLARIDDGYDGRPRYAYYPRQGERFLPNDVSPWVGEPTMQVGAITHNPRDMLTTLVAYVDGDNPQVGDMFSGDPFVDQNDNQKWEAGEPFFSVNGSNVYSPSQATILWKQVKVLWTGVLSQSPSIAKCTVVGGTGSTMDIPRGTGATFVYTLLDDYFNVLAANDPMDQIYGSLEPAGLLEYASNQSPDVKLVTNETGLELDAHGNFPSQTTEGSFRRHSTYTVDVTNAVMAGLPGDYPYSGTGGLDRHLTVDENGESSYSFSEESLPPCSGTLK